MHERYAGCVCTGKHQRLRLFVEALGDGDRAAAVRLWTEKLVVYGFGMREFLQFDGVICDLLDLLAEELHMVSLYAISGRDRPTNNLQVH